MGLKVRRYLTSVNASNCYLCWCEGSKEGVIIDPSEYTDEMRKEIEANGVNITGIFITHGHYDHDKALDQVRGDHDVPVYAAGSYPGGKQVEADDIIEVGESSFIVADLPGHTEDSIAFIGEGIAFVGDALFAAAVGGTSGRANFEREVAGVLENILSMPDSSTLYPGHGPATNVAVERCYNPFFI